MNDRRAAADVYGAELEKTDRGGALARRLRMWVWFVASVVMMGDAGAPSAGDLVVRRLSDGRVCRRIDPDTFEGAGRLLDSVREDLAMLPAEEFEHRWRLQRQE